MSNPQPKEVTQELERQAWRLRSQCWTQDHIAEHLGLSQETVSRMLKRMGEKLTKAFEQEIAQMRAEQTCQLQRIAEAAFNAWQACQQDDPAPGPIQEPDTQAQIPDSSPPESGEIREGIADLDCAKRDLLRGRTPNQSKIENQKSKIAGSAYLKIALKALADLRALWGLEAGKKTDLTPPQVVTKLVGIDLERFKRVHEEAGRRAPQL